jgi:hypothetical protein
LAGTTVLASVSNAGEPGNTNSLLAGISADGKLVAFVSDATNLVPVTTGSNAFIRDWQAGVTTQENLGADGRPVGVSEVAMSASGRVMAFVAEDSLGFRVLVRDRTSGSVEA